MAKVPGGVDDVEEEFTLERPFHDHKGAVDKAPYEPRIGLEVALQIRHRDGC
jgi:hypothetical protein